MGLSRRDLLAKCVSLGVVSLATNLSATAAAEAWSQSEKKSRPSTPAAETGPFYKRNAPNTAMMRASNDPGLPLTVDARCLQHTWRNPARREGRGLANRLFRPLRSARLSVPRIASRRRQRPLRLQLGHPWTLSCPRMSAHSLRGHGGRIQATGDANVLRERSGIRRRSG